jgi:predicted RNase H-like HicB family nuclease
MRKLAQKDIREINRLRSLFPRTIMVQVIRSEDGGFCAEIGTFPGCFTEANTFSELIEMINDAVRTYLDIPGAYAPFVPNYLPPLEVAQRLDLFPVREKKTEIKLVIPNRERVAS